MPYKNKSDYRNYMRTYMKNQRKQNAQLKRELKESTDLFALKNQFPLAYQLLIGKKPRRK